MTIYSPGPRKGQAAFLRKSTEGDLALVAGQYINMLASFFATIDFVFRPTFREPNAQALYENRRWTVYAHAGLFDRLELQREGILLGLTHEVGHALGGPPKPDGIGCTETAADIWAAATGMRSLLQAHGESEAQADECVVEGAYQLYALFRNLNASETTEDQRLRFIRNGGYGHAADVDRLRTYVAAAYGKPIQARVLPPFLG